MEREATTLPGSDTIVERANHPHVLSRLTTSGAPLDRILRYSVIVIAIIAGLRTLYTLFGHLLTEQVYRKDFIQEYVLARAIAEGVNPYLPTRVLAERYMNVPSGAVDPHPTPHPPIVGVLLLPIGQLEYRHAAAVWLVVEIVFLIATVYLICRNARHSPSVVAVAAITVALLVWYPVASDLATGQLMILLLLLLTAARSALLAGRSGLGGALVGVAVLIKPVPWPLMVLFAIRRDWRAAGASILTVVFGHAVAIVAIGFDQLVAYITEVVPSVTEVYRASARNTSLWTIGWRVFSGTAPPTVEGVTLPGIVAPPLINVPIAVPVVAAGLPLLVLLASYLVTRTCDLDSAFGLLICTAVLVSPVSWSYYRVLAIIPAVQVVRWLFQHGFPSRESNAAILLAALLSLPDSVWESLAVLAAGHVMLHAGMLALPPLPALLTLGPSVTIASLGLGVAILHRSRPDFGRTR